MWFWLAIIALLCWSGSDLFSKIGCRDGRDKYNPLKMVIAVGVVMGLHAAYEIFVGGAVVTWHVIWTYLPVSLLYIGSMTLGYVGLRYIELSISSPICNSSGALVAVLCLITGTLDESITGSMRDLVIGAVALVLSAGSTTLVPLIFGSDTSNMTSLTAMVLCDVVSWFAAPIYAWLLVQGFQQTRNRVAYGVQLLLLALIAEVP